MTHPPSGGGWRRARAAGRTRHEAGRMNKTEAARAESLGLLKAAGEITHFEFEPLKLRLADKTWYTPDFLIEYPDGRMIAEDVKGRKKDGDRYVEYWEEDAKIKYKSSAEQHSWLVFRSCRPGGPGEPDWVVSYAFPEDAGDRTLLPMCSPSLGSLAGKAGPAGRREPGGGLDVPGLPPGGLDWASLIAGPAEPEMTTCPHGTPYRWACEKCDEPYLQDPEKDQERRK